MGEVVDLQRLLGGAALLRSDGAGGVQQVPAADLKGKIVGVYFSAHW